MKLSPSLFENARKFYIGGSWVDPEGHESCPVFNPATEETIATLALGTPVDVNRAVSAARAAFDGYSASTPQERQKLLGRILEALRARREELAHVLSIEMGAPLWRALNYQTGTALAHIEEAIRVLDDYQFESRRGGTLILREPIGVCALITPWNAPIMQIVAKVAPALAAGCSMVLKPSEESPLSAVLFAEVLHEAGVPPGVFNLVQGRGPAVGGAMSRHPQVDMVSFTGSTRAGIEVARAAADTVKRVHQELGGKSANILLDDVDLEEAVSKGVMNCYGNSGQSCIAPDRMLIPARHYDRAVEIAAQTAEKIVVGDPLHPDTNLGPLINQAQFDKVQRLIQHGIEEGARLVAGGLGRPSSCARGYFVRPTVFADVSPQFTIAREEIFGPVISLIRYNTEEEAIRIANDTVYGLAGYVQSGDPARAEGIARKLRAGYIYTNYSPPDYSAPFGGYKQSGNGREYGEWAFEAFLELKTIVGTK